MPGGLYRDGIGPRGHSSEELVERRCGACWRVVAAHRVFAGGGGRKLEIGGTPPRPHRQLAEGALVGSGELRGLIHRHDAPVDPRWAALTNVVVEPDEERPAAPEDQLK